MKELFAIKDTVAGNYDAPFMMVNRAVARRAIETAVNDVNDKYIRPNFKDKQLFSLGKYSEETGEIETKVEFLFNLADLSNGG